MRRSLLILSLLVLINIGGTLFGYYYYKEQLGSTPLYLWVFVPDCPLYVMLFTTALLLAFLGFESRLFSYVSAVGMMKYGAWTLLALLLYGDYFFAGSAMLLSATLFVLHIGMFAEGPLLIPKRLQRREMLIGLGWFLLNDYFDYFYGFWNNAGSYVMGTHPVLPPASRLSLMMILTILLSFVMCFFAYGWSFSRMSWPFRKDIEEARFQKTKKNSGGRRRSRR